MEPRELTEEFIRGLPFAKQGQYVVRDTKERGFFVVVGKQAKTYTVQGDLRQHNRRAKTCRVALGRFGDIKLKDARRQARKVLNQIAEGKDPSGPSSAAGTLREAWGRFKESRERLGRSANTIEGYQDTLDRYLSDWMDRQLAEIGADRDGVARRHERITKRHGPAAADATMRTLRAIYKHAMKRDAALPTHPVVAVDMNNQQSEREAIAPDKLPGWMCKVNDIENPIRRDYYLFVLLTGMRREASAEARREHYNGKKGFLHVPSPKGGRKRAFDLPLSAALIDLLDRRLKQNEILFPGSPWIFPAESESGHIAEPKETKRGLPSPHILRHTYATAAKATSLPELDIKLLLNHKLPGVTGGYIHGTALGDHLRACQEKVSQHLLGLLNPAVR